MTDLPPQEQKKRDVEVLRKFKDTQGYEVLVKHARSQEAHLFREFLYGDCTDHAKLIEIREQFKAWYGIIQSIDLQVLAFDQEIELAKKLMEEQQRSYE